jgi:hypothetical protein
MSKMLGRKKIPQELQTRLTKYLEFIWDQELLEDLEQENTMMNRLPNKLMDEVYLHTNVKYLKKVKALSLFKEKMLIKLAIYRKKVRFSPD